MENWMTQKSERWYYYLYFSGQSVINSIVNGFLSTYLPMKGISTTALAPVLFVVKAWDAVNDVIFGGIFDKVKFKNGKCIPWLKISLPLLPLSTVLIFAMPNFSIPMKLFWCAVTYILWDTGFTLSDVPAYGLVTTMTNNVQERTAIMSYARIFIAGGGLVVVGIGTLLVSQQVGMSYTAIALIFSAIALIAMLPGCFGIKERNYSAAEKEETFTFREMFRYLRQNKYLLIYFGSTLIGGCMNTAVGLGLFVSYYLFGNELFNLVLGAVQVIPGAILAFIIPQMVKKIDKFKMFYWGLLLGTVFGLIMHFVGYQNLMLFIVLSIIRIIPLQFPAFLMFMFTPDCAEYGKYKTGIDARGISFAIQTFTTKFTSSISISLGLALIGIFGFVSYEADSFAELSAMGATQTPEALRGLWATYLLIPTIGAIIQLILLLFYKLNDKDVQIMSDCNAGLITREEAETSLSRKY